MFIQTHFFTELINNDMKVTIAYIFPDEDTLFQHVLECAHMYAVCKDQEQFGMIARHLEFNKLYVVFNI